MTVSKKEKWGSRGRFALGCFLCCLILFFVSLLFYSVLFKDSHGNVQITEATFWYYSGIIAIIGIITGGLFIAGLRAWDIQGLIYRVDNKWTANMVRTGIEELMKDRGWLK